MLDIVEKYLTIGGEANLSGYPIYLIRLSGCNLDCSYCDTPFRDEVNDSFTIEEIKEEIIEKINNFPELKILFTGGEPLFGEKQDLLIDLIKDMSHIEFYIETNGSILINNFELQNCHYVIDWKTPSSGYEDSFCMQNVRSLRIDNDCLKYVVNREDLKWVKDSYKYIQEVNPFLPVYLTPQWGKIELPELAEFIIKNKLPVRLSLQLHKYIWPGVERGV